MGACMDQHWKIPEMHSSAGLLRQLFGRDEPGAAVVRYSVLRRSAIESLARVTQLGPGTESTGPVAELVRPTPPSHSTQ